MLVMRGKVVVKPEAREAFVEAVQKLVAVSREGEGVLHYDVGESITEPNTFVSLEVYQDEEAARRNEQTSAWAEAVPVIQRSLAEAPSGEAYTVQEARPMDVG